MRSAILLLCIFLAGLLSGMLLLHKVPSLAPGSVDMASAAHEARHLIPGYVCPMHPGVVSNAPGSCPICGMDLEPKSLDSMDGNAAGVAVSPAMTNSLGVRIVHAEIGRVSEQVFATGNVEDVTPAQTTEVTVKLEGALKQVLIKEGQWVPEGGILLEIDAPEFTRIQSAYLEALELRDYTVARELRKELSAMGARQAVIDGVDRENELPLPPQFQLAAPHSGIVKWIVPSDTAIKPKQPLVRIEAPTVTRAHLRTYARAARSVKSGRRAQLDLPHMPGLRWPGRVVEVNHDEGGFYTLIEADFEVPENATHQGTFVGAYVNAGTSEAVLRVPATAVIVAEGQSRVVRLRADGSFEPVAIEAGYIGSEWAEIRSGLDEGDAVVARAQFLIDSEATLRAGMARLTDE